MFSCDKTPFMYGLWSLGVLLYRKYKNTKTFGFIEQKLRKNLKKLKRNVLFSI